MGRTKQTARKSTGGSAPRTPASPPSLALGKGKGVSKEPLVGKGGKGLGKGGSVAVDLSPARGKGGKGLGKGGKGLGKGAALGDEEDLAPISGKGLSSTSSASISLTPAAAVAPAPNSDSVDTAEKTAELIASFNATSSKIDVVFAFDTTGSAFRPLSRRSCLTLQLRYVLLPAGGAEAHS